MGNFVQLFPNKIQETVLERRRGDTFALEFDCYDEDGSPIDASAGSFLLAVNALRSPGPTDPPEFVLYGSGAGNVVTFPMTPAEADRVGAFFYDMQNDDAGIVRTFAGGPFVMAEDIVKGLPSMLWTPDPEPADGTVYPYDGSTFWVLSAASSFGASYETVDGTRVLRINGGGSSRRISMFPQGADARHSVHGPTGRYRMECLLYREFFARRTYLGQWEVEGNVASMYSYYDGSDLIVDIEQGRSGDEDNQLPVSIGDLTWFRHAAELDFDNKMVKAKVWDVSGAEPDWQVIVDASADPDPLGLQWIMMTAYTSTTADIDIAEFSWQKVG